MPDPITHATTNVLWYGGFGSAVALFFEVPPNVVGWALIGSVIAVMLLQKFTFTVGAFITMAGTFSGAVTSPFIYKIVGVSLIGVSFLTSFSIIFFWGVIAEAFKKAIVQRIEGLGGRE